MYKDNELYEINIDKLIRSFESNEQLSVEDYIDYKDEIFSIEKIFNKKFTEEQYKAKEASFMKIASDLYDIINTLGNSLKKDLLNKLKSLNKEKPEEILENSFIFIKKDEYLKQMKDIISGNSKEKGVPVVILGDFTKYVDEISGKWYNPISWWFKNIGNKIDSVQNKFYDMKDESKQVLRDKKSFLNNKDKEDRKNSKLFNVKVKREKGISKDKLAWFGMSIGGSSMISRWRNENAQNIFVVEPKIRIK